MKRFSLFLGFFYLLNLSTLLALKVYTITNPTFMGDVSQAEGVKAALIEASPEAISTDSLDARQPEVILHTVERDLRNNEKVLLIGAGEGGIDGIQSLPPHPNLMMCLTSHMLLERYKDPVLQEKVDFIALPAHVFREEKKAIGSKLIETVGVAHNRDRASIEKTYQKWAKELPTCSFYVGVILGGDAPLPPPAKGVKWFTQQDAIKLADYISSLSPEKKACVVVLNGPRTGKYDKEGKEVLTVHRQGQSDPITEFFLQTLNEKGIQAAGFDFQHKTPENDKWVRPYNSFDLVVGALQSHAGLLLVPGESTSMISEAVDTLPPGKVLVYENGAMNDVHEAHVASELEAGRVAVLKDYNDVREPGISMGSSKSSAAKSIVQELLKATRTRWP